MRVLLLLLLTSIVVSAQTKAPVVVELFTSEGCSDCPPADQLLMQLDQRQPVSGANIVVLGEHVDYWDGLGWHDRFSSAQFTKRQEAYANRFRISGPYTPEMVVNGREEFVGSDGARAVTAIEKAATKTAAPVIELSHAGDRVHVVAGNAGSRRMDVIFAITENGLSTHVGGGENHGRDLHHTAVVRRLSRIGVTRNGRFAADVPLRLDSSWNRNNLRAVVFLQNGEAGEIVSAAELPLK
ncbi:MAG: DUF1223 domain-containing protein [Terriglobales bacterium]